MDAYVRRPIPAGLKTGDFKEAKMGKPIIAVTISLSIATFASFIASDAKAGCGEDFLQKSSYDFVSPASSGFLFIAASKPSIVGMWNVKFISKGKMVDFGYSVWNSDGTEILNSG